MEYTKQMHSDELQATQAFLNGLLRACEQNGLVVGKTMVGSLTNGREMQVSFSEPSSTIRMWHIEVSGPDVVENPLNMQSNPKTGRVADSTTFEGETHVTGHIQRWLRYEPDDIVQFMDGMLEDVQNASSWNIG